MLKEQSRLIAGAVFCADLALIAGAFLLAHVLRRSVLPGLGLVTGPIYPVEAYLPLLPVALLLWGVFLLSSGTYRSHRIVSRAREVVDLARVSVLAGLTFVLSVYFFRLDERLLGDDRVSRSWIVLFVVLALLLLMLEKLALRTTAQRLRARGYNFRTVLVVGTGPIARSVATSIGTHRYWGFRLLGFLSEEASPSTRTEDVAPVLGSFDDLGRIVDEQAVDEVILTVNHLKFPELDEGLLYVQELGVSIRFAFDPFPTTDGRLQLGELGGIPLVTWSRTPNSAIQLAVKRSIDVVVAIVLCVALSPLLAIIALAIRFTSSGPVVFRQTRVGRNGREFTLYKFRTMVEGAERHRERIEGMNEMSGPVFKIRNDPRITPVGRFLRRFSLDELPQLWNVLKGEMSLVGPRPPIPEEVKQYDRWQKRRLSMRPGLTCLWQVGGRSAVEFERWMELDLAYIDNWSPWLDLKIVLKTIPVVLGGKGAY